MILSHFILLLWFTSQINPLSSFCSVRRNKYDILMEHVSDFLLQQSDHFTTVDNLKEHLVSIWVCDCSRFFSFAAPLCSPVFFFQNLNDKTMKRLFKNLRYSKLVEFCQYALEDLDPSAEHCTNKNGRRGLFHAWAPPQWGIILVIVLIWRLIG